VTDPDPHHPVAIIITAASRCVAVAEHLDRSGPSGRGSAVGRNLLALFWP
jgi:hypothetical protein